MSRSLQEQLLKAGVATEKQAKKVNAERRKHRKRKDKGTGQAPAAGEARTRPTQADKAARDRALNLKRQEAAKRKALAAEIGQIIAANRLAREGGETPYNFVDGTTVRRIHVPADMHAGLAAGRLAIVRSGDGYEVLPADVADRIKARDPAAVIPPPKTERPPDEDDPYADYPVPDDLIW